VAAGKSAPIIYLGSFTVNQKSSQFAMIPPTIGIRRLLLERCSDVTANARGLLRTSFWTTNMGDSYRVLIAWRLAFSEN
jgi:hypothetical protein